MATEQKEKNNSSTWSTIADTAKDVAHKTGDAVKDAASTVAHKASDAGEFLSHKANDATAAVGGEIKSLAGAMRDRGPHEGMLGNANAAVANSLESYGRDLQERGLSGIAEDITNSVRRHPIPAVLVGIGLGFMLARVTSK